MEAKTVILIPSCDNYNDAWGPFFHCFNTFWSDCTYDKYLITNYEESPDPKTTAIKVGADNGYSDNLIKALGMIKADYILLWLEDLLLCRKPEGNYDSLIEAAQKAKVGYVRLWKTSECVEHQVLTPIAKGLRFRVSLKPALWDKAVLLKLLIPDESPHDIERKGTIRSNQMNQGFYSLTTHSEEFRIGCTNLIHRGKYEKRALRLLNELNYPMTEIKRPIRSEYLNYLELKILNPILKFFKFLG